MSIFCNNFARDKILTYIKEKMKNNNYEELTDEELLKKRDLLKGVTIGFGIVMLLAIIVLGYLLGSKGFKNTSIAVFIPMMLLPFTYMPLIINYNLIKKEILARGL